MILRGLQFLGRAGRVIGVWTLMAPVAAAQPQQIPAGAQQETRQEVTPGGQEAKPGEQEAKPGEQEAEPGEQEATPGEQEAEPAREDPFRVDVNLVNLRFTVTDPSGNFVSDLPQDLFTVEENGVVQDIVVFERPRNQARRLQRLWLAFLIDVSGSTFATRSEEIIAAQTFLDNVTVATRLAVYGFTNELLPFQEFTADRSLVLAAMRQARKHLGQTAIYDSLNSLMRSMQSLADPEAQKAVIVISDGLDDAHTKSASSIALARQLGVTVYTIQVPSSAQIYMGGDHDTGAPEVRSAQTSADERKIASFRRLSSQTDGRTFSGFETILDFDETLAEINDHLFGNLYSIGYYSDSIVTADLANRINVRTSNPTLQVSSAFKKLPEHFDAKRSVLQVFFDTTGDKSIAAVRTQRFRELGADMDILKQSPAGGSLVGLPFRLKVNPYSFRGASSTGVQTQLGVLGLLLDPSGNEVVRLREIFRVAMGARAVREGRAIIYNNRLLAPAGNYTLQIALLEISSWRMTSFARNVRIRGVEP